MKEIIVQRSYDRYRPGHTCGLSLLAGLRRYADFLMLAVPVSLVGTFVLFTAVRLLQSIRFRCSDWCSLSAWW